MFVASIIAFFSLCEKEVEEAKNAKEAKETAFFGFLVFLGFPGFFPFNPYCFGGGFSLSYTPPMAKDFYSILGVDRGASQDDIKKAYRKMSKELHPDKHKGDKDAETKFKDVNQAYETLSNPQKRQMYDQFGEAGASGGAGFDPRSAGFDFSGFQQGGQRVDFGDLFESFFGGAGGQQQRQRNERGDDHEIGLAITFAESVSGIEKTVSVRRLRSCDKCKGNGAEPGSSMVNCSECGGTGQVTRTARSLFGVMQQQVLCPKCHGAGKIPEKACGKCSGEGRVAETSSIVIRVPAGVESGQTLRMRGEGDVGRRGATAGDLYVHIDVEADPRFQREGDDVRTDLKLNVIDAILGTEATVDTVHGSVTLSIPAGTQPGQVFRIKNKGMPVLNTSRFGDHYVTATVEIPTRLNREEKRILEEWRKAQ